MALTVFRISKQMNYSGRGGQKGADILKKSQKRVYIIMNNVLNNIEVTRVSCVKQFPVALSA